MYMCIYIHIYQNTRKKPNAEITPIAANELLLIHGQKHIFN